MPSSAPILRPICSWKFVFRIRQPNLPSVRLMATTSQSVITSTPQPRLTSTPQPRLTSTPRPRSTSTPQRRLAPRIPIPPPKPRRRNVNPPPSARNLFPDPISEVNKSHMAELDPTGVRQRMFSRSDPDNFRPGDILLVTFKTGDPFAGVCLSIRRRGPDTSVLLRNHILLTPVEMWVKVFSPLVSAIELVKRAERKIRRARLYYMRKPKHDRGSVENVVNQYLKARRLIRSGAVGKRDPKQQQPQQGQKRK